MPVERTLTNTAYYFDGSKNLQPSLTEIENQISLAFSTYLDSCINNYQDFPNYQIEELDTTNSEIQINNNQVKLIIKYPIKISKDEDSANFKNFEKTFEVKINDAYEIAKSVVFEKIINNGICLNCLFNNGEEKDVFIEMYDHNLDSTIFVIVDQTYKINGEDFTWYFAIKN